MRLEAVPFNRLTHQRLNLLIWKTNLGFWLVKRVSLMAESHDLVQHRLLLISWLNCWRRQASGRWKFTILEAFSSKVLTPPENKEIWCFWQLPLGKVLKKMDGFIQRSSGQASQAERWIKKIKNSTILYLFIIFIITKCGENFEEKIDIWFF